MKYCCLIIYFFETLSSAYCQSKVALQWNGLKVDRSTFTASTSFRPLHFNNHCIIIQGGLHAFRIIQSDRPNYFPCIDTKEVIKLKLMIFPNPSINLITVKGLIGENLERTCYVRIIDLLGRVISSKFCKLYQIYQGLELDVSILSAGTYYLVIQGDDVLGFAQFIKITG